MLRRPMRKTWGRALQPARTVARPGPGVWIWHFSGFTAFVRGTWVQEECF